MLLEQEVEVAVFLSTVSDNSGLSSSYSGGRSCSNDKSIGNIQYVLSKGKTDNVFKAINLTIIFFSNLLVQLSQLILWFTNQ